MTIQLVHDEQRFAGSSREGGGIEVEGNIRESAGKGRVGQWGDEVVSTVPPSSPTGRGEDKRSRRVFGRGGGVRGGLRGGGGGGARLQLLCQLWRLYFPSWMCLLQGSGVHLARKVSNSFITILNSK